MLAICDGARSVSANNRFPSRLPANRQCATVKRYIDHHYKENLTLDELAEKVIISKYHMAHAFKREYGVSPINYII